MIRRRLPDFRSRRLASKYRIGGTYRRVYHYHVRKTGGTSLNRAFWELAGVNLRNFRDRTVIRRNGIIIARGAKERIEAGHYFFASSHIPAHKLTLPAGTFTITLLRNPVDRFLSYYRYLLWAAHDPTAKDKEPFLDELQPEIQITGGSFSRFLDKVPKRHLLNQLFMFSREFDVSEAADRVLTVSALGFTDKFDASLDVISRQLDIPLKLYYERRFPYRFEPSTKELERLRDMLDPEFRFFSQVRRKWGREMLPV